MRKEKVYITGHLYAKAREENWLTSLAYFMSFSICFPHKRFHLSKLKGRRQSTTYKHLHILQSKGLLTYNNGIISLISNKALQEKYEGKFKIYTRFRSVDKIKQFLKIIPSLSNLHYQKRADEKRQNLRKIKHKMDSGKGFVTMADIKSVERFVKKKSVKQLKANFGIHLSIDGFCRINNVSKRTAVRQRKFLNNYNLAESFRNRKILKKFQKQEIPHLRRYVCPYLKWDNKLEVVYQDTCTGWVV